MGHELTSVSLVQKAHIIEMQQIENDLYSLWNNYKTKAWPCCEMEHFIPLVQFQALFSSLHVRQNVKSVNAWTVFNELYLKKKIILLIYFSHEETSVELNVYLIKIIS